MILNASTALLAAHQASRSARRVRNARQMSLSKAETARPTILAWHGSCGVPREETVVAPISVACTPHDPELHMNVRNRPHAAERVKINSLRGMGLHFLLDRLSRLCSPAK